MSNKTTAILTFLVSTVIPFIQEVVDFIDMFRTGSYNREGSASLKAISLSMQDDLANFQKRGTDDVNGFRHTAAAATEEKSYSRFLEKNR
nr:MAG TPA: hypothetical protein [Microviridae sp.]